MNFSQSLQDSAAYDNMGRTKLPAVKSEPVRLLFLLGMLYPERRQIQFFSFNSLLLLTFTPKARERKIFWLRKGLVTNEKNFVVMIAGIQENLFSKSCLSFLQFCHHGLIFIKSPHPPLLARAPARPGLIISWSQAKVFFLIIISNLTWSAKWASANPAIKRLAQ